MKPVIKIALIITCVISGIASFAYLTVRNRDTIGEYYAESSVNVEIDKQYSHNIAASIETWPGDYSYWMSPATNPAGTKNVIMYINIPLKRPWWNLAIQFPEENARAALAAVDNIAVFIGSKTFYFSHDEVQNFKSKNKDGYALFYVPGLVTGKSFFIKNGNYYGDINLGIKALSAFFIYPGRFIPTWLCLILLLFLCRKNLIAIYEYMLTNKRLFAFLSITAITAAGFILRWNGYDRHSGWSDDIASAIFHGNPNFPLISVFSDPGNPPFYYFLLRLWFQLFGWSEEAGKMLSVILGTLAIPALYCFIKPYLGRKAALCGALFTALSGFEIGYSHEMRPYILKMFLVPLIAIALFNFMKKPDIKNLILYIIPAICIVNAHGYGVLFVMANFVFFIVWMLWNQIWEWKPALLLLAGNIVIALTFMPFLFFQVLSENYDYSQGLIPQPEPMHFPVKPEYILIFVIIAVFAAAFLVFRKDIAEKNHVLGVLKNNQYQNNQYQFVSYLILIPVFIFTLALGISFFKPMIDFRYLWPVNAPLCFALAAALIYCISTQPKLRFLVLLAVYIFAAGLYGTTANIWGGGTESYKEARAYIAADAAAHPELKSVMLGDSTGQISRYYGFPALEEWTPDSGADVLYVYCNTPNLHESNMYDELRTNNIDDTNILKVYFPCGTGRGDGNVVFKKYLKAGN